ncbi:MAG: hypothetical protein R2712_04315 [Vicinamibacterales bacterium]
MNCVFTTTGRLPTSRPSLLMKSFWVHEDAGSTVWDVSGVDLAELEPSRPVDFESVMPKFACHRFDMRFLISNATPL